MLVEALEDRHLLTTFVVTDLNDNLLANLEGDAQFSLREAIHAANTDTSVDGSEPGGGADEIVFSEGLTGTIILSGTRLEIFDSLTITGPGAELLTINGNNESQIFFTIGDSTDVTLSGMTLTGGNGDNGGAIENDTATLTVIESTISGNSAAVDGGGLRNARGTLTVTGSTISGNTAGDDGGGLDTFYGAVTVTNSTISGNTANDGGGLTHYFGTVTVTGSTISGNTANVAGGGMGGNGTLTATNSTISGNSAQFGGGLFNEGGGLTVTDSTISGNLASGDGGGLYNHFGGLTVTGSTISGNTAGNDGGGLSNYYGTVAVTNTTISDNSANSRGGGLANFDGESEATLTITDSTISGNSASLGGGLINLATLMVTGSTISGNSASVNGGGLNNFDGTVTVTNTTISGNLSDVDGDNSGTGGGVWTFDDQITFTRLFNTIVAGNLMGDMPSDLAEKNVDADSANNLIGDPLSAGGLSEGILGNLVGNGSGNLLPLDQIVDPSLADNGGPTLTHALAPGSRAIDAGDNTFATTLSDQRGAPFARVAGASVDIGAYELQDFDANSFVVTTDLDVVDFNDGEVSLREAILAGNDNPDHNTITFGGSVFTDQLSDTIALGGTRLEIRDSLTITGPVRSC